MHWAKSSSDAAVDFSILSLSIFRVWFARLSLCNSDAKPASLERRFGRVAACFSYSFVIFAVVIVNSSTNLSDVSKIDRFSRSFCFVDDQEGK